MARAEDSREPYADEYLFADGEIMLKVLGPRGENIKVLERELGVAMGQRGHTLRIRGAEDRVAAALRLVDQFARACRNGKVFGEVDLVRGARILAEDPQADLDTIFNDVIHVTARRRLITPKSLAQKQYVEAIRSSDLTLAIGPAGTGKTYLAVAVAVSELMRQKFRRIVLTRPAVEAGERLGFLPGDMVEKVNPYLRPLYDALDEMLDHSKVHGLIAEGQIEIAPLAFMRGRTLNDSFVILDEAQNTTREQMKMFLTRLGYSSKAVVNGDISQVDLAEGVVSGLVDARQVLAGVKGISFCTFTEVDVVRHPLVQDIIRAYDARSANGTSPKGGEP